ncbi:MFS transporter [Metabacillus indicus]|uniref:MFS transporter n=1 Tax=Metabacillus indicus TaxID=246786 RepID=UPI00068F2367|nr:MFS transporter [Metabacillus indicus]
MAKKPRTTKNHNIITLTAVITALSLLGDSMLYIALPIFWKEAGLDSIWQVGILLSINRFIRLPVGPAVGWLYKRIPLKTGLLIAVCIGGLTTLGYGLFKGFIAWIILRSLWGIAWSFFRIGGLSAVALYSDESRRGEAMGSYNGIYRLGSLAGMLIGGLLVPYFGLTAVSIVFGFITLIGIPLILLGFSEKKQVEKEKKIQHISSFSFEYRQKLLIIVSGFFITLLIQGVLTATLSSLINHHFGKEISLAGLIISVTFLSGLLQSARWMWEPLLAKKIGRWSDQKSVRNPLFIGSLFFSSLSFSLISYNLPAEVWIVAAVAVLLCATAVTTLSDTLAIDAAKHTGALTFLTFYSVVQDAGAALGPFLGYMIIGLKNGFSYLFWGGAVIFSLLGLLWILLHAEKKSVLAGKSESAL